MRKPFNIFKSDTWPDAFVAAVDGSITAVKPKNGEDFSLEELQGFVGGYIEVVHCANNEEWLMVVNEEGKNMQLPPNTEATQMFDPERTSGDFIAGPALICRSAMMK